MNDYGNLPMVRPSELAELRRRAALHDELVAALRDMTRIARAASIGVAGNKSRIERAVAALAKAGAL